MPEHRRRSEEGHMTQTPTVGLLLILKATSQHICNDLVGCVMLYCVMLCCAMI